MVASSTLTSKGQVTIPVEIRRKLRLEVGAKLDFALAGTEQIVVTPRRARLEDLFGIVPNRGRKLTIRQMDEAIGQAVAARDRNRDEGQDRDQSPAQPPGSAL